MENIELVIKIPRKVYRYVQQMGSINMLDTQQVANAIFDGTPLPKGHGRLKDVDALDTTTVTTDDYSGNKVLDVVLQEDINDAPTIIEADKSEET